MEAVSRPRTVGINPYVPVGNSSDTLTERRPAAGGATAKASDTSADRPEPLSPKPAPQPAPRRRSLPVRAVRWAAGWAARTLRRLTALALLLLAAWFWALPFFFPMTGKAVVNARTVQVRTPIGGEVAALDVAVGDRVGAGAPVFRVAGRNVDTGPLATARARHAELLARRTRLTTEVEDTAAAAAACEQELERYKLALVANLGEACREGRMRVEVAELVSGAADRRSGRVQKMAERSVGSVLEQDDTREAAAVAKARIDLEKAAVARTEKEREAVGQGLFVTRETPIFQVQARELAMKRPRLRADLAETGELLAAADRAVRDEEERVGRLTDAPVPAPVAGVVWKRPAACNQVVDRNETVLEIADGKTVFVEALVHQRHLSSVGPGYRATVCLTGGATLTGRVRAARTPNPGEAEQGSAVALTDGDPRMVKVVIELDGDAPDTALIGRHARVLLTDPGSGEFGRGVEWLFTRLRF